MPRSDNEPIDLARFAEISAHLRYFPADKGVEVLTRLGLDDVDWRAARAHWLAARRAELDAGGAEITRQFGRAFGEALARLAKLAPDLASLGAAVAPVAPVEEAKHEPVAPMPVAAEVEPPRAASIPPFVNANRAPEDFGSTLPLGARLPLDPFPFKPGAPGITEPARVAPPPARPARSGETVALAAVDESHVAAAAGIPELTLPQYASLRVDLHQASAPREAILARYGLDESACLALDAHWRASFDADPLLRMMFAKAYATYLGWLRRDPA